MGRVADTIGRWVEGLRQPPEGGNFQPTAMCSMAGASGSGKTLFCRALGGPSVSGAETPGLIVRPRFDVETYCGLADIRFAPYSLQPSADAVSIFEYDVRVPAAPRYGPLARWMPSEEMSVLLKLVDAPGGAMFPNGAERDRVFDCGPKQALRLGESQSLIFCVNAAEPDAETLHVNLPVFLSRMAHGGYLPWRSVLVLLTHVDRVATTFLQVAAGRPSHSANPALRYFREHAQATPWHLCRSLDPVALARSAVGDGLLNELWQRLAPGARFGVGVACAAGFDLTNGRPSWDSPASGRLSPWGLLGLDEAVRFCLSDEPARDRALGTIVEYSRDGRAQLPSDSMLELQLEDLA